MVKIRYEPAYFERTVATMRSQMYGIKDLKNYLEFSRSKGASILDRIQIKVNIKSEEDSFRRRLQHIEDSMPDDQFAVLLLKLQD